MKKSGLVISRKPGQKILIKTSDGVIAITYIGKKSGKSIMIRFEETSNVEILREELTAGLPEWELKDEIRLGSKVQKKD